MSFKEVATIVVCGALVLAVARAINLIALIVDGFLGWILCGILLLFG